MRRAALAAGLVRPGSLLKPGVASRDATRTYIASRNVATPVPELAARRPRPPHAHACPQDADTRRATSALPTEALPTEALPSHAPPHHAAQRRAAKAPPHATIAAIADLPTRHGDFRLVGFDHTPASQAEHTALIRGSLEALRGAHHVPVRLHSECLTGDAFGSYRCDCRDQLEAAMADLAQHDNGILLYLRQEGRGIGLTNKIRAYALQQQGLDTVQANHALGFADDERDYAQAAAMLRALGVASIDLMSNNPRKIVGLQDNGIRVAKRLPHIMTTNVHNARYLHTKQTKSGHLLDA